MIQLNSTLSFGLTPIAKPADFYSNQRAEDLSYKAIDTLVDYIDANLEIGFNRGDYTNYELKEFKRILASRVKRMLLGKDKRNKPDGVLGILKIEDIAVLKKDLYHMAARPVAKKFFSDCLLPMFYMEIIPKESVQSLKQSFNQDFMLVNNGDDYIVVDEYFS